MQGPKLKEYYPTLRERVEGGIYDIGGLLGADPRSQLMRNIAGTAGGLLDFIPFVGDYVGGEEAYRDYKSGDYYNAGIGAAATTAGILPFVGDAAGKAIKSFKRPLIVQHNKYEEPLRRALLEDGIPAPSMAVVDANNPLTGFGNYSLFGGQDLAKPSATNPVYPRDAYTPREPEVVTFMPQGMQSWSMKEYGDIPLPGMIQNPEDYAKNWLVMNKMSGEGMSGDQMRSVANQLRNDFLSNADDAGFQTQKKVFSRFKNDGTRVYLDATPKNRLKVMLNEGWSGSEGMFGPSQAIALASRPFSNISEIKDRRSLLGKVENFEDIKSKLVGDYFDIKGQLTDRGVDSREADFIIEDLIGKGRLDPRSPLKESDLPSSFAEDLYDWVGRARQLPTEYFEVKPKKVIKPDQFKVAIVPSNAPKDILDGLEEKNIKVRKYDGVSSNTEVKKMLDEFSELFFSVPVGGGIYLGAIRGNEEQDNASQTR